jgi:hypothetical protein
MGKDGKTPKKDKKDKKEGSDDGDGALRPVCAIAKPLADVGFHKKILKVVKKVRVAIPSDPPKTRPQIRVPPSLASSRD